MFRLAIKFTHLGTVGDNSYEVTSIVDTYYMSMVIPALVLHP